ncbi:MAG: hypothetical protein V4685_11550, partial [Bacteroidota bacterium]
MKKIFITLMVSVVVAGVAMGQGKFAASLTNTGNLITFKLMPDQTVTTGFSTIEFFVRYPDPSPAFTYGTVTVNTAAFPGMAGNGNVGGGGTGTGAWEIERDNPAYLIPGFHVDHFIFTAPAVATTPAAYTGATPYDLLSVTLVGTPPNTVDLQFVSDDFESTYYLAITDQNGGDLRPASLSNYFFPATQTTAGPSGSTIYFQELLDVPLPVKFLNFTATKNKDAALLTWAVENEDANTVSYEIQKSVNGVDFTPLKSIPALNNGRSSNVYSFTQDNLSAIRSSGVIYFRVKQTDRDGKFVHTEIRSVRLSGKDLSVAVYPNPVKNKANVSFDLDTNKIGKFKITEW